MASNVDRYHRKITYLRISVTDRCNLRCVYCNAAQGFQSVDHSEILSFEEIIRVVKAAVIVGIHKLRFTGGEPLVRKGFVDLVRNVRALKGLKDVSLTTNGVLLKDWAGPLFDAGIRRVNVSLDTLIPEKFKKITGQDALSQVLAGLEAAETVGFSPIRINVVVIKGMNDDELRSLAKLSFHKPYQVRFIEYMPVGNDTNWAPDRCVSVDAMKASLTSLGNMQEVSRDAWDGPARRYRFQGAKGEIGFISPMTHHFCSSCNRLRLTADGKLRPCLLKSIEVDVKTPQREGMSDEGMVQLIKEAIDKKPKQHYATTGLEKSRSRPMWAIGG